MGWLVVGAKVFPGAMQARLHGGNARSQGLGYFGVAAALLHEGHQGAILGTKLGERVAQGVQFLAIDGARLLGNVFMLGSKGKKNAAQLLPAQMIDAGVARKAEQPRFELGGGLKAMEGANHFDEYLLRYVLHGIAATGHGVDKSRDAPLVGDDKIALGDLFAVLGAPDQVDQRGR